VVRAGDIPVLENENWDIQSAAILVSASPVGAS
jgi:hypothetical protein